VIRITRPRPNMSPMRPAIGVATHALSRNAVTNQEIAAWSTLYSLARVGSSGVMNDCSSPKLKEADASAVAALTGRRSVVIFDLREFSTVYASM
jgi:hypothetical protein